MGDELEYEVESMLLHRDKHHVRGYKIKHEFLIKWLGYGPEHNTWEPQTNKTNKHLRCGNRKRAQANVSNCPELLSEYWAVVKATDVLSKQTNKQQFKVWLHKAAR